ncbi:hypothetical protein PoB_000403900 [Plakobranchus ocellatus]|uniref:Secreted protein n=1 Tax=Plakobranchus ocellatus TaxID=259542 RepID=A0AAV3Y3G2_9GAST|nr:hypothetical protein PoB_000403900 [Plakobranchus ocellatus]
MEAIVLPLLLSFLGQLQPHHQFGYVWHNIVVILEFRLLFYSTYCKSYLEYKFPVLHLQLSVDDSVLRTYRLTFRRAWYGIYQDWQFQNMITDVSILI